MKKQIHKQVTSLLQDGENTIGRVRTKMPVIGIFIGLALMLFVVCGAFYNISKFYDSYRVIFQTPGVDVTIYWPVVVQERKYEVVTVEDRIISPLVDDSKPRTSKPQTKEEIVAASLYSEFIDHIWLRESGRGTNTDPRGLHNICAAKGVSNEFGYAVADGYCFNTFEESVRRLEKWYEDNLGLSDNQKLCKYNSGRAHDVCPYLSYDFANMN